MVGKLKMRSAVRKIQTSHSATFKIPLALLIAGIAIVTAASLLSTADARIHLEPRQLNLIHQRLKKEIHEFDDNENFYVNPKKNAFIRRTISLKAADIGEEAIYGDACDQALYDQHVKPIYSTNKTLSFFERSDMLLDWLDYLEEDMKNKSGTSNLRQLTCGAMHLMACIEGVCKCLGEVAEDDETFQEYEYLKPVKNGTTLIRGEVKEFTACMVESPGMCNPAGGLDCHPDSDCINVGGDPHRCFCAKLDEIPEDAEDFHCVPGEGHHCCPRLRERPRSFQ